MRKASARVHIPGLSRTSAVEAAEAVPTDFVDIETSHINTRGGLIAPDAVHNARIPNWQHYDTARFLFGPATLGGTVTAATIQLWGIDAQELPYLLGSSVLSAGGAFPDIDGIIIAGRTHYAVRVASIAGSGTPSVLFNTFAQGYFRDDD